MPSDLYADASHPLADGYRMLADVLFEDEAFAPFLGIESGEFPSKPRDR